MATTSENEIDVVDTRNCVCTQAQGPKGGMLGRRGRAQTASTGEGAITSDIQSDMRVCKLLWACMKLKLSCCL